jgi:hypothetical protein
MLFGQEHGGFVTQPLTSHAKQMSMSLDEVIAYQRDILAVKSRIVAALMPRDRETSATMQLVIAASQTGTNGARLAKQTGLDILRVRSLAKRLRHAKIWNGNAADATEWQTCLTIATV